MTRTQESTPERFGPYELVSLLGRGGMGEVHRAYDTSRKRTVALKLLPRHLAGDGEYQARFRREAEVAARLTEPHIIPIHDYGEIDGTLYIDMRLIKGVDLADVIAQEGPLPAARAVNIIGQVGTALAAAHAEGLVHRDVKPSNVLISTNDRGEDFVHLVDFGIAHEQSSPGLTATGATIGTIDYMAPERLQQERTDHRVDVYALGCVLYEALTASKPFPTGNAAAKMYAHMHTPPPRPTERRPDIPRALDDVVTIAMAKNPDERYRSTTDLATAAYRALSGAPPRPGGPPPPRPPMGPPGGSSLTGAPTRVAPGTTGYGTPGPSGATGYGMPAGSPGPPTGQDGHAATRVSTPPPVSRTGTTAALTPHLPPPPRTPAPYPDRGEPPARRSRRPLVIGLVVAVIAVVAVAGFLLTRTGSSGSPSSVAGSTVTAAGTPGVILPTAAPTVAGGTGSGGGGTASGGSDGGGSPDATTVVTDANGRRSQLRTSTLQLCSGDGVSLTGGQVVPTSTISRIQVTYASSTDTSLTITQTNGQQVKGSVSYGCAVSGETDIGPFSLDLSKIQSVEIHH